MDIKKPYFHAHQNLTTVSISGSGLDQSTEAGSPQLDMHIPNEDSYPLLGKQLLLVSVIKCSIEDMEENPSLCLQMQENEEPGMHIYATMITFLTSH